MSNKDIKRILVINGVNLDMLGTREPDIYGTQTLADLQQYVEDYGRAKGLIISFFHSNCEGGLIKCIHEASKNADGIVYNPGAHTHYSYALRDAISGSTVPCVEVHLSDIDAREPFRQVSVIAPACVAQVKGRGVTGYCDAIDILLGGAHTPLGEGYEKRYPKAHIIVGVSDTKDANGALSANGSMASGYAEIKQSTISSESTSSPKAATDNAALFDAQIETSDQQLSAAELAGMRLGRIRQVLTEEGLDAAYLRGISTIRWATAFDGVFDSESAHALVVTPDCAVLQTDSRYQTACKLAAEGTSIIIDTEQGSHPERAAKLLARIYKNNASTQSTGDQAHKNDHCVLAIESSITLSEFRKLETAFPQTELRETQGLVLSLREIKDAEEVRRMKAAQAITDAAFAHIIDFIRVGMTEREIQLELESFMLRHGAEGLAFPSIVATGAHGANPHAIPGEACLMAGQCVVLDFGARVQGYCADMTRTIFLGQPSEKIYAAYQAIRRANEEVAALLRPGVTGAQAHECAERVLAEEGFAGAMGHGLGHAVGIDVHETPLLSPRNTQPLKAGNVVTIEPGIYIPGEFGMRLEDFGLVTENGFEVFTQSSHEMVIL